MGSLRTRARTQTRTAGLVASMAMLLVLLPGASDAEPAGPVGGWGTTTGTDGRVYMADEQGRALQFHGFNVKTSTPAATVTDQLLTDAASRGMDHLRLGFYWQDLEPKENQFDESFLDQLVTVLDRAEAHGIRVILDMHQDVYGEAFDSKGIPAWATRTDGLSYEPQASFLLDYLQPAVQAAFDHLYDDPDLRQFQIDAWLKVVNKVKDHPALFGYDLLNEPFGKIREGEDLFTAAARVEREQLTPMYQRLTDAISAVDSDHWVFFEPPNLASLGIPTSLGKINGPKVALYPHMYDPDIESATYNPGGEIKLNPEFFDKWAKAVTVYTDKYPVPMLVGEWGVAHPDYPGMDEFVERTLQTLDRVSSGWSMFAWCRGEGYCPLDANGNDRPGIGQIFQPYARAIAGAPISTRWDRDLSELRLRFDDNDATGTTDIYIGANESYPDGWKVQSSDAKGTWSSTFDPDTQVLSVTTAKTDGTHAICVTPAGSPLGCPVDDPEPSEPTPPPTEPGVSPPSTTGNTGTATPAQPVAGQPIFTG